MRRAFTLTLLCAIVWASSMVAAAASGLLQGRYEGHAQGAPKSEISFKLDRDRGDKGVEVFGFRARRIPTDCAGHRDTAGYRLDRSVGIPVRGDGRFRTEDSSSGFRDDNLFVLRGRIKPGGGARGTLKIVEDFDGVPDCNTGRVRWTASR